MEDASNVDITAAFLWLAGKGGVVLRSVFYTWVMISASHRKDDGPIELLAANKKSYRMAKKCNLPWTTLEMASSSFLGVRNAV